VTRLTQRFRVTHPFQPLFTKEFEVLIHWRTKDRNVLVFYDDNGQKASVPVAWTDLPEEDPFILISAGRSHFRAEDLVRLCDLIDSLRPGTGCGKRSIMFWYGVKKNTPEL
jgi:hypothetical protein